MRLSLSSDATGCLFYKRSRKNIPQPLGGDILHFSFENVTNEQKSEAMLNVPKCEHL